MATVEMLAGVRVLDLGRLMPSAMATLELAKLGADVVKVEMPPFGDYLRINPPLIRDRGDMHLEINRSKRSVGLRFDKPEGRDALLRMVESADVFVELSRPGAMEKLGLGYDDVRAVRPDIVYASFSGFGQDGPYASLAAHGLSADAASGFMPIAEVDGHLALPEQYVSVGPRASGLYGAVAILAGLFQARLRGVGSYIDVAQSDAAVAWNYRDLAMVLNTGAGVPSYRELGPRYAPYECADGSYILFAATEPKLWRAFCAGVERPDLEVHASDGAVEFGENDVVRSELTKLVAERTQAEWIEFGLATGVPIAPMLQPGDVQADPHLNARGMLRDEAHPLGGTIVLSGHPVQFDGRQVEFTPAPELGQHSPDVLGDYGFSAEEIAGLVAAGIVETYEARK